MNQLIINPGYVENTEIYQIQVKQGSFEYRRLLSENVPLVEIINFLQPFKHIPIFVDPASPEVSDHLKKEGFWVLK